MNPVGIKVDVEAGVAELADEWREVARYHRAGEAKGNFVLHAICDSASHTCTMNDALTTVPDFPDEIFVRHPSPGQFIQPPFPVVVKWEAVFRYVRADAERSEKAKREYVIDADIELRIEELDGKLSPERKDGLRAMKLPELQQLARELQRTPTRQDAITAVVKAITDSRHARRAADAKKFDELDGGRPAKVGVF